MAFQIDPNIPLQAQRTTFDPASILMQAQQNGLALEKHRFEMQKLREDYDLAKEQRKQQKAMQMGIASDLAGIQAVRLHNTRLHALSKRHNAVKCHKV